MALALDSDDELDAEEQEVGPSALCTLNYEMHLHPETLDANGPAVPLSLMMWQVADFMQSPSGTIMRQILWCLTL